MRLIKAWCICAFIAGIPWLLGQQSAGSIRGEVTDVRGDVVPDASVKLTDVRTKHVHQFLTGEDGTFLFPQVPIGEYELEVEAPFFNRSFRRLTVSMDQSIRLRVSLDLETVVEEIEVLASAGYVDTGSLALGKTVTELEISALPLNGRNFSQLGLMQVGVVPLTSGVTTHGGSRRSGQAYVVNGQRPESNNYLLDGVKVVNRLDGGYAIKLPLDAIAEFKILTHTASPEYGGTSGSNTSIISRSGGNEFSGVLYHFIRNDVTDARNFFAQQKQPLKQNQFGGTLGGPVVQNRVFFFAYWESFRNRQGVTRGSTVPTAAERSGDFSALATPLLDLRTGQPVPGGILDPDSLNPISKSLLRYYPLGNRTQSFHSSTRIFKNDTDQVGGKVDVIASDKDHLNIRYSISRGANEVPFSILGADVPGFPVGDDLKTQIAGVSHTRSLSTNTVTNLRASFFRHRFLMEKRLSGLSPRSVGFDYDATLKAAEGSPFFLVSGYSSIGDPTIGPRDTVQNNYDIQGSVNRTAGNHTLKFGAEYRIIQINTVQGLFANGVFAFSQFPYNNSFANFLVGRPSTFTQAGGDFHRGLRGWEMSAFIGDEWTATNQVTLTYGLRYEISTPFSEVNGRLNAFAPGQQSVVRPDAPRGVLYPGDPGITDRIAPTYKRGFMPRIGIAWDPTGTGKTVVRAGYGIFFDPLTNGVGGPIRIASQTVPWTRPRSISGTSINFNNPFAGEQNPFDNTTYARPMTLFTLEQGIRPPYAQNWNFSINREIGKQSLEVRYVGTKGTRLPRFVEANPAVYGPGATAANADRRRIHAGCQAETGPCTLGHVGLITNSTNSIYHAGQLALSRRFAGGLSYNVSYTLSKTLDYVSSLHLAGPAPLLISGENDVAQNPFDLAAERGASLFDSRHRLVVNAIYEMPFFRSLEGWRGTVLSGWQMNTILTVNSAPPFTVYDSRNVSLQAVHPPLSGVFASRPDLIADPNQNAPHRPEEWISRSAFRRLDPVTEAGKFGNTGRSVARGAGFRNLDLSLNKTFLLGEDLAMQFRAECFNILNNVNFGLPVNDLASPNFGRILEAGPARTIQMGLKLMF